MNIRDTINQWLDERDKKGVATYGEALDECNDDDYDWNIMIMEELLDGIQYAAKENIRLRKENQKLRERLDVK